MKTLKNCKTGDTIMSGDGSKSKVLFRIGNVIARSGWYSFDEFSELITIEAAHKRGYKILKDGKEVMKKKEVENLLNIKIVD